ncbi:MAG TPA: winged helix-turn-helix domain-containing protein [Nitrososphaeraceae archaeon]|jgi:predicted transcriptional regulator|nr:winged helix-turn-helix domain-containing protein [Nitrososphaeraceae archaeon]HET8793187.1 winged helix-turn-helix domain-containing protein [Nitrososphaeraceae archaeon]HJT85891.1 winged helix-turn-helix domain-containing protein [Nitrososphaeraceae archaeon]
MSDPDTIRLLWFLFAGSRGGDNRIKILDLLLKYPLNINRISEELQLDYKTVKHHIDILEKNNLITRMGDKYGILYFISNYMEKNIESYYDIKKKINPH